MALGRRRVEKQHFQAGFVSVRGGRLDGRSGFPSCHGLARVSPRPNAMSRRARPQPWLRLQLQHNQEGTRGAIIPFWGRMRLALAFVVPSTRPAHCHCPVGAAEGEEEEEEEHCRGGDGRAPGATFIAEAFWTPPVLGGGWWCWRPAAQAESPASKSLSWRMK